MMYLWIKAFHLIAIITWFAGIFYLPRLFVYHSMADDEVSKERFKVMERKLYRGIMNPSMIVALTLGITFVVMNPGLLSAGWMHAKLLFVVLVIGYHHACGSLMKKFAIDQNQRSDRWFRVFNELPVIALVIIVIMVIVKPF